MSAEGNGNIGAGRDAVSGLNHGPGSFAHNNADQLPGGRSGALDSERPLTPVFNRTDPLHAAQVADHGKTEAERRQPQTAAQERAAFNASRRRHAPAQAPVLRPDHTGSVDRASFYARQRQEHSAARLDQNTATLEARAGQRPYSGTQTPEEKFKLDRSFTRSAQNQTRRRDQNR